MSSNKEIYVFDKQNLLDTAVKYFGDVDAVFDIIANNNVDFSAKLETGQILDLSNIEIIRSDLVKYFEKRLPATDVEGNKFTAGYGFTTGFSLGFNS